jgi:hypothetical protein
MKGNETGVGASTVPIVIRPTDYTAPYLIVSFNAMCKAADVPHFKVLAVNSPV